MEFPMSPEIEIHIQAKNRQKAVAAAMATIIDATNVMGSEKDVAAGILEGLLSSHKTLQQSFMRAFIEAMKEYADTPFRDARNEASVEFARKVKELDVHFPFI
jgi:hypothetical protein